MTIVNHSNPKTRFTRMCIAEAILLMLEEMDYSKLRISSIVKKAGVARMTFYKYYNSPYDALVDYMNIMISQYLEETENQPDSSRHMEYENILHALQFFDRHARFFLTLAANNLYSILLDGINGFMEKQVRSSSALSIYKLYAYAGSLLNTFLKWEMEGKKDRPEDVARMICEMYHTVSV